MEAMVSLVPNRIDGTFRLRGLSSQYDLVLNYDYNTGSLLLSPQMVGVIDNKAVYFLTWSLNTGGRLWLGEDCALKLVWNNLNAFTFTAADPDKYPCESAILMKLFYDENDQLDVDDVTEEEWLTNQNPQFPYLTSLIKIK